MEEGKSYLDYLNPQSEIINREALGESSLKNAEVGQSFQFLRLGYFTPDYDFSEDKPVYNRVSTLRDSWAKQQNKNSSGA